MRKRNSDVFWGARYDTVGWQWSGTNAKEDEAAAERYEGVYYTVVKQFPSMTWNLFQNFF